MLVVEDDPTLARSIARNLTARGYAIGSATTVAQALDAVRRERPTLVLLDIDLPDGLGWDVLRALRAAHGAVVPAIVMSALRPNPRLCAELQVAGVLEKPFAMESLLRLVATWIGNQAERPPIMRGSEKEMI